MELTDEQFCQRMLDYLEGKASRDERIELMSAIAESEELCSLFNNIMALEKMTAEAEEEGKPLADDVPLNATEHLQN